jgi:hypothetical protein
MSDSQWSRAEVQWGSLRPILQEMADRIARIEQALAAAGLQAPSQPMASFGDVFEAAPASFGSQPGPSFGSVGSVGSVGSQPAASFGSQPAASLGQVAAAAHGVNLGGAVSPQSGQIPDYIVQLARSGKKIQAIKELRDVSGMGLKEAKDVIDQF